MIVFFVFFMVCTYCTVCSKHYTGTFVYLIYTVDFDDDYLWIYRVSEAPEENVGRV